MSSGQATAKEYYDITDVTARYVRITGHGSTASAWNSVTELSVH
jgi:unsaturated chondroitin disaccharide hydrolase